MENIRRNVIILTMLVILGLSLACVVGKTVSQVEEIKSVLVNKPTEPQTVALEMKNVLLSNCEGSNTLTKSFGSEVSVSNTSAIESTARSSDGSEVQVSPTVKLQLQTELEKAYQQTLSSEISHVDAVFLTAKPGTSTLYEVQWEQHIYSSTISYNSGNTVYDTAYEYKINIPKIATNSQLACNNVTPTQSPVATQASCQRLPKPHVTIGQTVTVIVENSDKLKLRSKPGISPSTEIKELDQYTKLVILEGPVCITSEPYTAYWFWKVKVLPNNETGWVAEGNYSHYFIIK